MTKQDGRQNMVLGSVIGSVPLVFAYITGLPVHLLFIVILAGLVLFIEGAATMHNDQTNLRFERTIAAQKKMPPPYLAQPKVPPNVKDLIWDWANKAPTDRRYAQEKHQVSQEQWQRTVRWAVRHGLGELVPAQGGAEKLRWTAHINEALNLLDGLAVMA